MADLVRGRLARRRAKGQAFARLGSRLHLTATLPLMRHHHIAPWAGTHVHTHKEAARDREAATRDLMPLTTRTHLSVKEAGADKWD